MINGRIFLLCGTFGLLGSLPVWGQQMAAKFDLQAVQRGKVTFKSSCGFCHGDDATGSRAPDLIRSPLVSHDQNGDRIGPVIHNGRPDKGMPAFPDLKENQISDIVTFLHSQGYEALHSSHVPGDYPIAKLLVGNAESGKAYFQGTGGCSGCHSVTGDFAGIAKRYRPIDLQQRLVYPGGHAKRTAVVTLADGTKVKGVLKHLDEFTVELTDADGWYHSWPTNGVRVEVQDPLAVHRELTGKYTDADIHNLFAFLETLQ